MRLPSMDEYSLWGKISFLEEPDKLEEHTPTYHTGNLGCMEPRAAPTNNG